jgi:CO/xanthine dehydrogenase FAD-binding subunit
MLPATFEYHRVASVKEALVLIRQFGDDTRLLAGGHSLLPMMKLRLVQPAHLIDIARISELSQIAEQGGRIVIGAAVTHDRVASSELVRAKLGLLAQCADAIGDVQVRNLGTLGGSLSHADPAADYPAGVLALEAEVRLQSEAGVRTVRAEDFFSGPDDDSDKTGRNSYTGEFRADSDRSWLRLLEASTAGFGLRDRRCGSTRRSRSARQLRSSTRWNYWPRRQSVSCQIG